MCVSIHTGTCVHTDTCAMGGRRIKSPPVTPHSSLNEMQTLQPCTQRPALYSSDPCFESEPLLCSDHSWTRLVRTSSLQVAINPFVKPSSDVLLGTITEFCPHLTLPIPYWSGQNNHIFHFVENTNSKDCLQRS